MKRLKVAIVTTSRADYGLLYPLVQILLQDAYFDISFIATGSHLSLLQGLTIEKIKEDGIFVAATVEMNPTEDTEVGLCDAISKGINGFSKVYKEIKPDLVMVLGDRYELWSACIPATLYKIPIAHIHGGEITKGAIDDAIRHAITKMSAIHFPTIDLYAKRIIQMGENAKMVFAVGALGIDNIKNFKLMSQQEICEYTKVDFNKNIALMTYHPVTLDGYEAASMQIDEVLGALLDTQLDTLITMPNSDTGSNTIYEKIVEFTELYPEKFFLIKNLGQIGYLSAMKHAKLMIGNSSSGIIESASFRIPVVNIGDRQEGRLKPENVIDCICNRDRIHSAIEKALSEEFHQKISDIINPYGDGNTASQIKEILKAFDFENSQQFIKKGFCDMLF